MGYFAHTGRNADKSDWQALPEHLFGVADLAEAIATPFGLGRAARIAGLFHDLGKYDPRFQRMLEGLELRVDHSTAGARVLKDIAKGADRGMADIVSYAILGHHAGLPNRNDETASCVDMRLQKPMPPLDPIWKTQIGEEVSGLMPDLFSRFTGTMEEKAFSLAFAGRMIFGALVDADFKDTERHYVRLGDVVADRDWPALASLIDDFTARFDAHMARLASKGGELGSMRHHILTQVRAGAARAPGLFTLTVPTGGGKTLASLGFALDHARIHGHRRILYAIPFTSIIDQTARIFREVLGEAHVLEQHAAIDEEQARDRERRDKLKLAMEDWAAPVIVTTNVQLFESLFSARTSRARKLPNIAGSIIILDEAQTLPRHLLVPVMRVLRELTAHYGCTVVLCTATQPALGKRETFPHGLDLTQDRELAPDPQGLAEKLARTRVRHGGDMDNAALIAALRGQVQGLVIVNSRAHALDLYREAQAEGLDGLIHLTTRLYAAHRRRVLEEVRNRLKDGRPCRLIATSLIEAGVDVDFPAAWRAEAGLDQIVQAAGRVNREGRRSRDASIVTVFRAPDYTPPAETQELAAAMRTVIGKYSEPTDLEALENYFHEVYWREGERLDARKILKMFNYGRDGTSFSYRDVSASFQMIEDRLVPVIVALEDKAREAVDQLSIEAIPSGKLLRDLQPFVVQIPRKDREALIACGEAAYIRPDLRADQFVVLQKAERYSQYIGLFWEAAGQMASRETIW